MCVYMYLSSRGRAPGRVGGGPNSGSQGGDRLRGAEGGERRRQEKKAGGEHRRKRQEENTGEEHSCVCGVSPGRLPPANNASPPPRPGRHCPPPLPPPSPLSPPDCHQLLRRASPPPRPPGLSSRPCARVLAGHAVLETRGLRVRGRRSAADTGRGVGWRAAACVAALRTEAGPGGRLPHSVLEFEAAVRPHLPTLAAGRGSGCH